MKALTKSVLTFLIPVMVPVFLQGAAVAQVVSEDPDGATYDRGASYGVTVGMELMEGDTISTKGSTLILSLCEGSLITIYPNSEVQLVSGSMGAVSLKLMKGEILGDASAMCEFTVETKVGTATMSDGVYGVVHTASGNQGWGLQVRNLDGSVKFVGGSNLDTSNVSVSLVEPGKEIEIPAGEEMVLQGVYNPSSDVFALLEGGAVIAVLDGQTIGELRSDSERMANAARRGPPDQDDSATDSTPAPLIIDIPVEDIETASDKG